MMQNNVNHVPIFETSRRPMTLHAEATIDSGALGCARNRGAGHE